MNKEIVSVKRLDECLKNIEQLDFIKIDVEGFEAEVLEGSLKLIEKFKPYILIEIGWGNKHPNWPKNLEIYKKLFEIGYKEQDLNFSETKDILFEPKCNIVDVFPYFNEEELLELRIRLLDPVVDKFIICDANRTHSGNPKEFTCRKTLEKLGLLSNKIKVLEIDFSEIKNKDQTWNRERLQRDFASSFIDNNDICIVSDCDEIINPNLIKYYSSIAEAHKDCILRIPLILLNGRADLQVYDQDNNPILCTSPYFCCKDHLNSYSLSEIREASNGINKQKLKFNDIFILENNIMVPAGWHFTWMGDNSKRLNKYKSFMHYYDEILNAASNNQKELENFIFNYEPKENNTDVLGRNDHILKTYPIENLPKKIFEIESIKSFLLPN